MRFQVTVELNGQHPCSPLGNGFNQIKCNSIESQCQAEESPLNEGVPTRRATILSLIACGFASGLKNGRLRGAR